MLVLTIFEKDNAEVLEQKFIREIFEEIMNDIQTQYTESAEHVAQNSFISSLRFRDLRRLDPNTGSNDQISLTIRQHTVLLSMDPLYAIVMYDKVVLFIPDGADSLLTKIPAYIRAERTDKYMNFESCAYDAIFRTFYDLERDCFQQLAKDISDTLVAYRGTGSLLPLSVQEEMRNNKNRLSITLQRISAMRLMLQDLIADEEEMSLMNLSMLNKLPQHYKLPLAPDLVDTHDLIEELLETHLIDFSTMEINAQNVQSQITYAEESMFVRLDTQRNELYIANTILTILSCGITLGGYIAGMFGMNFDNTQYIQNVPGSFVVVTVTSFVGILLVTILGYVYMKTTKILPERLGVSMRRFLLLQTITTREVAHQTMERIRRLSHSQPLVPSSTSLT